MLRLFGSKRIVFVVFCGLLILIGPLWAQTAAAFQTPDASTQESPPFPSSNTPLFPNNKSTITQKQQDAIIKENLKKAKKDAEKLSALADSLKKEIQSSNPNVMSIDIVSKTNQIEKLAKKIKEESEM
ncbi:MAG TPA: hypothetical protein VGY31_06775 [Terriglobia bacterium]|nr:hypothetical protein [Terriglobia bacterium]